VYGKDEKDDMSKEELAVLCDLARAFRAQLLAEARPKASE
jgi:hypothetical protein